MTPQLCFFVSIAFSLVAWGTLASRYVWPRLRLRSRAEALQRLLTLHSFRFIGLAFLVPGVVSSDLPSGFARSAACGDIIAAALALLSLQLLSSRAGVLSAWIFNLWGAFDLLSAFYHANQDGLIPGQLGAAYFIPTVAVPLLLVTHAMAFRILLRNQHESAMEKGLRPA